MGRAFAALQVRTHHRFRVPARLHRRRRERNSVRRAVRLGDSGRIARAVIRIRKLVHRSSRSRSSPHISSTGSGCSRTYDLTGRPQNPSRYSTSAQSSSFRLLGDLHGFVFPARAQNAAGAQPPRRFLRAQRHRPALPASTSNHFIRNGASGSSSSSAWCTSQLLPGRARKKETRAYQLASTMGTILTAAAIPYKFSGGRMEIIWLVEVEGRCCLPAGAYANQYLRILAAITGVLLAGYIGFDEVIVRTFRTRRRIGRSPGFSSPSRLLTSSTARLKSPHRRPPPSTSCGSPCRPSSPPPLTLAAAWVALDSMWVGLVWLSPARRSPNWAATRKTGCCSGAVTAPSRSP